MGAPTARLSHVDMAFAVQGGGLPRDHSAALWRGLVEALPQLEAEDTLAVLPVRAASAGPQGLVLQRRSRLLIRLAEASVDAAMALCGRRIRVGEDWLEIGAAKTRALMPHRTLYAHRVASESGEEAFLVEAGSALGALGVHREFIVGRRSTVRGPLGELAGYSLMLEDLSPEHSLALQVAGLGAHRRLGFGIFVGHK